MVKSTSRVNIHKACEEDIKKIIEIESDKENSDYIWSGTYEEHKQEIEDSNFLLWVFKTKDSDKTIGFMLAALDSKSEIFELRRIAITDKGKGYGKEVMNAIIEYAFEEFGANRFWLDVYPDNLVGIKLYEKLGMKCDGVLRQSYKSSRGYLDQIIYSILKSEYYFKN